jgi:hypothetical protein
MWSRARGALIVVGRSCRAQAGMTSMGTLAGTDHQ